MQVPSVLQGESRTRFLQGVAVGAIAAMVIGFAWGGWVTGGTARSMATTAQTDGQMSVLVPLCVTQFMAGEGAVAKIKVTPSYGQVDVVREFVKTVAGTQMDYGLARACAAAVHDTLNKTAAKSG